MIDSNEINLLNRESLQLYKDFLSKCSDVELSTPMPAGWTVSAVLGHLVFWDQRGLTLLEKWEKDGIDYSAIDTDVVNEVTRFLCLAIPPRAAVDLFFTTAERINNRIAKLDAESITEIEEKGKNVHLNRAKHRMIHLEEIK
ncbi:MAG TPA: maleylpyruvate isomerase N-terminal domain-containing protein, partial [Leptolinea sp.]